MEEKHCKWYNDEFCTNGDSPCVADYCPLVEYPELCKCKEIDEDTNVRSKDDTDTNVGMTNEEIIKALEMGSKCCEHNYLEYWELVRACQNGLDLIQHLQDENERLTEDNKRLNELLVGGTEVIDYWNNKYLEEQYKNAELQKQVDELKEENARLKQGKAIMLDGITDLNRLVQFPVEYEGKNFEDIAELGNYIQEQAEKDTVKKIFGKIFEVICCFSTKGKSEEYNKGYIDCLAEVDKRLQNLVQECGVEVE